MATLKITQRMLDAVGAESAPDFDDAFAGWVEDVSRLSASLGKLKKDFQAQTELLAEMQTELSAAKATIVTLQSGTAKLTPELKAEIETTATATASRITAEALAKTGNSPAAVGAASAEVPQPEAANADPAKAWDANPKLQAEWGNDKGAYFAYHKAEQAGQVRLFSRPK